MEVIVAKSAGFCFGVKRAVDSVYSEIENSEKTIYTYGPIIHNEQVVKDLENKGVRVINEKKEIEAVDKGTVIIRSHGVAKEICDIIDEQNLRMVDATCPFVKKIHNIVREESEKGKKIVIIGNDNHRIYVFTKFCKTTVRRQQTFFSFKGKRLCNNRNR